MKCESADGRVQTRASDPRSLGLDQTGTARRARALDLLHREALGSSELHGRGGVDLARTARV